MWAGVPPSSKVQATDPRSRLPPAVQERNNLFSGIPTAKRCRRMAFLAP